MTISAVDSSVSSLLAANTSALSSSASSTSELTEEEKKYDVDDDGELSITEKAAMLEAQAKAKELEASTADSSSGSDAVSVSISQKGLEMQRQNPTGPPKDANEIDDEDMQERMKEGMNPPEQNEEQRLMNEAISEYKKFSPEYAV